MDKEREEWEVEIEKRKILQDELVTDMRKSKFIDEIANGLGKDILEEPNKKQPTSNKPKSNFFNKLSKIFR